jgi:hypothetical protein
VGCQLLSRVFLEHSSNAEEDRYVARATTLYQYYCFVAGFPVLEFAVLDAGSELEVEVGSQLPSGAFVENSSAAPEECCL